VFPWIFPLITNYWSQNTAKIKFIASKEAGWTSSRARKIVNIYHDSAYGKETIPVLDAQAKKYASSHAHTRGSSGERTAGAVAADPADQARLGDPARLGCDESDRAQSGGESGLPAQQNGRCVWSGAEEDVIPAGDAAKGFYAAASTSPGPTTP